MSAHVSIDRLVLRVPGLTERDAQRLAGLLADRLAEVGAGEHSFVGGHMRLGIDAIADEPVESLARRIADELLARIARSS